MPQEVLPLFESPKFLGHPLGYGTYLITTSLKPRKAKHEKNIGQTDLQKKISITLVQHYGDNLYNFTRSLHIL